MSNRSLGIAKRGRGLFRDERGVAALEYAALLGLVLLGITATLGALGRNVSDSTASISKDLAGTTGIGYVETAGSIASSR